MQRLGQKETALITTVFDHLLITFWSALLIIQIISFPYNARSDWLKQRALSENRSTG